MKHLYMTTTRRLLACVAVLLLSMLGATTANAEDKYFGSGEVLYFKAHPSSWSDFGDGEYHYFAYFYRGLGDAWSSEAVPVAGLPELMQVYAPEGTWSHVILVRKTDATPSWDGDKEQTGDIELSSSSNYLHNFRQSSADKEWRFLRAIRVFGGTETFYINKTPPSWSDFSSGVGSSLHAFLYFFNDATGASAWSGEVADNGNGNWWVNVPAGTWTHVIIVRKNNTTADWSGTIQQTGNIAFHDCYNYLYDFKQSSSDDWWLAQKTFSSSDRLYIKKHPSTWSSFGDGLGSTNHVFAYFFHKNSGAGGWSSEATEYEPGFLEVTPPTGTWTHVILTRQNSTTANWSNVIKTGGNDDQSLDITLEENSNYLHNFCKKVDGDTPGVEWWKWIKMGGMYPTTSTEAFYNGAIKREQLDVCADAYTNLDPLSLTPTLLADKKDYNFVDPHVWFKWEGDHWKPMRYEWGEIWVPLSPSDPEDMFFFLWSNYNPNTSRFLHVHRKDCPIDCEITSFKYVLTPVNVSDSTFAIEGIVAFTKQAGDLVISYGDSSIKFTAPLSPQIFSLKGLKADNVERTLRAQFKGVGGWTADSLVTAPGPNEGVVSHKYDDPDAETHYSVCAESFIHGSTITLTPHVTTAEVDSFAWTDSSGRLLKNGKTGDCTYQINKAGNIYMHELGADTTLVLYYTEYNLPPADEGNLMNNGDYETIPFNYDPTSAYEYTKDYGPGPAKSASPTNIIWDGAGKNKDVYDYETLCGYNAGLGRDTCYYYGKSSLFGVATNANYFWNRFAHIESREKVMGAAGTHHLAVFDGDSDEQVAWQATTVPSNPKLKLQQGSTYMFSFWVANVNNFGEMISQGNTNNAILQFKIHYKDKKTAAEYEQFLGDPINLNDDKYLNNFWHQNSATFTSPVDADEVTISVVDKNTKGLRIGNDFALDDIRFRAVSIQSSTIRARERFEIKLLEPPTNPVNLQVEWVTRPACGQDTCTMRVSFRYPNITTHDIKLTLKDLNTSNSYGTLLENVTLAKTPILGNTDSTDYVGYFTSGSYGGATYKDKVKADAATHNIRAKLTVLDANDVDHGGQTNESGLQAPGIPALAITDVTMNKPDCSGLKYTLDIDLNYTALSGTTLTYYVDNVSKATRTIDYEVTARTKNDVPTAALDADGKEHTLKVSTGHALDCIDTYTYTAPKANIVSDLSVAPIQPDCDEEKYRLIVSWEVTKPAVTGSLFDTLMIKVGDASPYEILIKAGEPNMTISGNVATGTFEIPIDYAIGASHPTIKAYMKERGTSCAETASDYTTPTVPRMTIGTPTFENISCNKTTFDLVVPVTYTNQHGDMYIWIDDNTPIKVTDAMCKTGTGLSTYAANESERLTKIIIPNLTLTGDHYVNVECDGIGACHRTKASGKETAFTAPILPSVDRVFKSYSTPDCNDPYTTLTFDFKYANQPAGTIEIWVDDDKAAGHMITLTSASGDYTAGAALATKEGIKINNVPADSLETHKLHIKSGSCDESFTLPRVPFMPKIEEVSVDAPSSLACGGSSTYTATVTVTSSNYRNTAVLCVSLNGGTPQVKSPNDGSQTFIFSGLDSDGSSNTVKAWFKCVGESCNKTATFTAPTLPQASLVTPITMPDDVAACDQPTFDLTFDLKYTYQDGELQVWVDDDKKGYTTFAASDTDGEGKYLKLNKSEQTKTITLTGLPSDGGMTHKLYYKFDKSGFCNNIASPLTLPTFPRSPTITGVTVSGVPGKVADCTVETYDATVTVEYQYTSGEQIMIGYTDKDGDPHTYGPVALTGSPQDIVLDDLLNDIGKGSKALEVYFQKSLVDFSECHHPGTYTAPSNSSINSGYDVTVTNASACGERKYNLSGTITYVGEATGNLHVQFKVGGSLIKDSVIAQANCSPSGTAFTMTGLTTDVTGHSLIAYFEDQPKCTAASNPFDAPDICGFDAPIANMSFSTVDCGVTTTTLTFNLNYTYQNGDKLQVWVDGGSKKEDVTFEANENNEKTIANIEIPGVLADGNTHILHVQFVNGRCPEKTFTTPNAPFNPKPTVSLSSVTTPQCYPAGDVTVSYTQSNAADIKYTVKLGSAVVKEESTESASGSFTFTPKSDGAAWSAGIYKVYVTPVSGAGCIGKEESLDIVINPLPAISELTASQTICEEEDAVSYDFTITGAETYSYSVAGTVIAGTDISVPDGGSGTISFDPSALSDGSYTLQVTAKSEHGCTTTRSATLKINNKPTVALTATTNVCYLDPAGLDFNYTVSDDAYYYEFHIWQADRSRYYGGNGGSFTKPVEQSGTLHKSFGPYGSALDGGDYLAVMWIKNSAGCMSDSVEVPFTIYPLAMIEVYAVESLCADKTKVKAIYHILNAQKFRYKIEGKTDWSEPQTPEGTDDLKQFSFDISSLDAGSYTLQMQAYNDKCGYGNISEETFTIYPLPTLTLDAAYTTSAGVNVCYPVAKVDIPYTSTNADTYTYELMVGSTKRTETKSASASGNIEVNTDGLPAGDYALSVTAVSEHDCKIAAAQTTTIHINPRPTFTFNAVVAHDCYPSTSISVGYTSTNAKTYSYTLTKEGAGSPIRIVPDQSAADEGAIVLNTTGLAAGTYELVVTAKSNHNCDLTAPVTKTVTIYNQPTIDITSVENHCEGSAEITVNYTTEHASNYTYEVVGEPLSGNGDAVASGAFKIDISSLEDGNYTLRMHVTSAHSPLTCDGTTDEYDFVIWAVPDVHFTTPTPIKEGVADVMVSFTLPDAETYDWRFMDGTTELESGTGVDASNTSVTLTTGALDEGTYTLFVTPKTSHCTGEEKSVHVVVNNKPTVNFTDPDIVCAGSPTLNIDYSTSLDATDLYYTIINGTTPVGSEQHVALTSASGTLPVDISALTYGDYTLTGHVKSALENGDDSEVNFTLLAVPTPNTVTQDKKFIACEETYEAAITVNIFNAAGRDIYAKYTDNGDHTTHVETLAGDQTATLTLPDLTHTDLTSNHQVLVYVDGFEDCGITVGYPEPKLMKVTEDFEVTPLSKSCGDDKFSLTGKVFANCNTGKIVVEYNDTYKDEVDASTAGSTYTIADIPAGGSVTKLKAYFQGKTCGVVESAVFAEPTKPEASISYVPYVTPPCDVTIFDLEFTLNYTYQEAGTLTIWVDNEHKNTYTSANNEYQVLNATSQPLSGKIEGLPADGRTGQKLYFEFSGDHSCKGSIDLDQFPQTPLITGVKITGVPTLVPGVDGTYDEHKVTVTYEKAIGEYIVLEYFDKDNNPQFATSTTTVTGDGFYEFTGVVFNDVAVDGTRYVYAYFKDSECTRGDSHTDTYHAPSNSSVTFVVASAINHSLCGKLLYDIVGKVKFVGSSVGDLIVELVPDATKRCVIPESQCVAGEDLAFTIKDVGVEIPTTGIELSAYFADLSANKSYYTLTADLVLPELNVTEFAVDTTYTCGDKSYTFSLTMTFANQRGTYYLYDSIAGGTAREVEHSDVYPTAASFTIARPAATEYHYVIVRIPDTRCEGIYGPYNINPYTMPQPLISLTPVDHICNSETELILPFAITQGDIDKATLTLVDNKGKTVVDKAALTINDSKDTLTYLLPEPLNAGKHMVSVEAHDALDCATTATLPIELAQDRVIYSKWNDVLLVDNSAGLYAGYQWYENDKPVGDNSQVLYRTDGMTNNSYYCLLTLKDGGQIYTCEYIFQDITPSVEEQQPSESATNRIVVRPNRVVQGGAVTVQQSEPETLRLVLLSSTGQRLAEYTQTESTHRIDMPSVQGVYLLRIASDNGIQTVKIVVY